MSMHVTSLELSKTLYHLSGWKDTEYFYQRNDYADGSAGFSLVNPVLEAPLAGEAYPAYDLGYLLRRLPTQTRIKREYDASPDKPQETPAHYRALYDTADDQHFWQGANTPEDAAALVAIELLKAEITR